MRNGFDTITLLTLLIVVLFQTYAEALCIAPGSNCVQDSKSCTPMTRSWERECTDKEMDKISCAMYQNYAQGVQMVVLGAQDTEGAYIKCNNGVTTEECLTKGAFSEVGTIDEATPSSKIATLNGSTITQDGQVCFCPLIRCDARTEDLKFKTNIQSLPSTLPDLYKTVQIGDNICLMLRTTVGYVHIGCKAYKNINPTSDQTRDNSCFSRTACTSFGQHSSKVFWSVTSRLVECVQDMLDLVFFNEGCTEGYNALPSLQKNLRTPIMIAIVLYIVLLGIKIVSSGELIKKSDVFTAILKIGLVFYLVIGTDTEGSGYSGGLSIVFNAGESVMSSLSEYIINASSTTGLCRYNPEDYADKLVNNKTVSTSYLALWDSLDCRIAYYLGLYRLTPSSGGTPTVYGVLSVIIPALFSLEIIFAILLILYAVFMLVFLIYFVHFYIICLIMLAITVYLGVIIVPMILFDYTKQFFDQWVKLVMSYAIQPVIIIGFLALSFLVFDNVMFGNCQFTESKVGSYSYWSINDSSPCTDQSDPRCTAQQNSICSVRNSCVSDTVTSQNCQNTIGYVFLKSLSENAFQSISGIFFDYTTLSSELIIKMPDLIVAVLKLLLFAYFFVLFSENVSTFAGELSGGLSIGKYVLTPQKIWEEMKKAGGGKKGAQGQQQQGKQKQDGGEKRTGRGGINVSGGKGGIAGGIKK